MKAIFHIHTKYSFDSLSNPKKIVDLAWRRKIDYVFITDHNTIQGALEAKRYAEKNKIPVKVIIGEEIETDIGDIIGIFLKKGIKSKNYKKVIEEIKKQGGMVVLPHPYLSHNLEKVYKLSGIDFVEIWNGRTIKKDDKKAKELKKKLKAREIVGSDAHLINEIFNSFLFFDSLEDFKKGRIRFKIVRKSGRLKKIIWLIIKKLKKMIK